MKKFILLPALVVVIVGCGNERRSHSVLSPVGLRTSATNFGLVSTIAFTSTRDNPTIPGNLAKTEIYLIDGDGTNTRRLTENNTGDIFPTLSPDGKKIVFDSNRLRVEGERNNTSDLFVMNTDGTEQTWIVRGGSPTWSPDGRNIAFHASASGIGVPINNDAGQATTDSDIFTLNLDDALAGLEVRRNLTNNPEAIDDDPDWSPDGQKILFTSHLVTDTQPNHVTAEIYVMNADGTSSPVALTSNTEEERAPSWSPDGSRIVYMARKGSGDNFEICVMNADGSGQTQLTNNTAFEATPTFSPDGSRIVFHRLGPDGFQQLWQMNSDGTGQMQISFAPGHSLLANWGELRVHSGDSGLRASR